MYRKLLRRPTKLAGPLALLLLATGCASQANRLTDNVVERDRFAHMLGAKRGSHKLVILDVRDKAAYDAGHVAGAVRIDTKQWTSESLKPQTDLSHEAYWHERIGDAGITGRAPVVVYGNGRMTEAARIWFILQHFGVKDAAIVNGGYPALKPLIDTGLIPASRTPTLPAAVAFRPRGRRSDRATIGLADRQEVRKAIDDSQMQVLDARTPAEYAGTKPHGNARPGHIPHAVNLPHKDLLDAEGRLKSPESLAKIFEAAGFRKDEPIITHCQSGGRASLTAIAAKRAGFTKVLDYYKSYGDWSKDSSCPVEKGDGQ